MGRSPQVLAISSEDRAVYFRQGVTSSELSGKTWKAISVPRDGDRSHSSASTNSLQRLGGLSLNTRLHWKRQEATPGDHRDAPPLHVVTPGNKKDEFLFLSFHFPVLDASSVERCRLSLE